MSSALGSVGGCLVFAVAFGGVGVFTGWLTGVTVYDGWRARGWTPVAAEVTADDGFRYEWQGRSYTSWRLTPLPVGESDVDGSDKVLERFAQARNNGKPVTVYVNPKDPGEAMAERAVPWMFVVAMTPFVFGFGGVGLGALWALARNLFPWVGGLRVPGGGLAGQWILASFWNVIAVPLAIVVLPDIVAKGQWIGLAILLFPLVGAAILWAAIAATLKQFRGRPRRRLVGDERTTPGT